MLSTHILRALNLSRLQDGWPVLEFEGRRYAVAPRYIGGVGIAEALALATLQGCQLPTVAMAKAIYEAADCKLDARAFVRKHDGTYRTMASEAVLADQEAKVSNAIEAWEAIYGPAKLVAGTHKDVVNEGGRLGLYGWQKAGGTCIQPAFYGHAGAWKDYSQGARLVTLLG